MDNINIFVLAMAPHHPPSLRLCHQHISFQIPMHLILISFPELSPPSSSAKSLGNLFRKHNNYITPTSLTNLTSLLV